MTVPYAMDLTTAAQTVRENPRRKGEHALAYVERIAVLCGYMQPGSGAHPADHEWNSVREIVARDASEAYWNR